MHITEKLSFDESEAMERMTDMFGPAQVDQMVRQAVQHCWMSLPKARRNLEELEKQVMRLVLRALKDFREDRDAFARETIG